MRVSAAVPRGPPLLVLKGPLVRTTNPAEERVLALIEPVAEAIGLRIVRIRLQGLKRKTLQIMAERRADGLMALEDCERLSRAITPVMDEADPIGGEYNLEVSSPGIDRPLMEWTDFARFAGHEAKVETAMMIDGRRRFRGVIRAADETGVTLALKDGGEATLPIAALSDARLVLTDALIEEDLRRAKAAEAAEAKAEKNGADDAKTKSNSKTKRKKPQ